MKVFKSLICIALCFVMVFGAATFGAYAQETARLNISVISGAFSMSIDGGYDEFMGESYSNTFAVIGDEYTVTAEPNGNYSFLYWKNSNGKILSTDEKYTFVFANDTSITAVYDRKLSGVGYVTFLTSSGQELSRQLYSASVDVNKISVANDVSRLGYIFKGWSIDGVNPIPTGELRAAIKSALASGNVMVTPIYEKDTTTSCNVSVINGEGSGSYVFLSTATVTAKDNAQPFSYWLNDSGEIVSFSREYTFVVTGDDRLTAVYGTAIDKKIVNRISGAFSDSTSVTFIAQRSVDSELNIIQSGIIITNGRSIGTSEDSFVIGASGIVKGTTSSTDNDGTYMLTKVNASGTWYARPYVIYADANGEIVTSYGAIAVATVE